MSPSTPPAAVPVPPAGWPTSATRAPTRRPRTRRPRRRTTAAATRCAGRESPASARGVLDVAALPGLVAVGDARGVPDPTAGNGVALAMAQALACASAIVDTDPNSVADLERLVAAAWAPSVDLGVPEPRRRPL